MSTKTYSDLNDIKDAFREEFDTNVFFDEPLAPYLAYQVGGPADILVFPKDEHSLEWIAKKARHWKVPITIVGNGTNLLVVDEGIRGITICLQNCFLDIKTIEQTPKGRLIRVGSGVQKNELLDWSISQNLTGLEFSAGVPGTIGGGIYMNAGTKYGSYGDILTKLRLFDFSSGITDLNREEVSFGYREQTAVKDTLVVWVNLQLTNGKASESQKEVDRIIKERAERQPLAHPSCGSTFKNPIGFSAGRLIEKAGLKGLRVGGAEISLKHGNFILNKDNASAQDILTLITLIKEHIKKQFDVDLECEVITLGPRGQLML